MPIAFLRILEYYSGILFLTTNRVGAIDDAFRSRLHLILYYPQLTETQTLRIWQTNLQRLKDINAKRLDTNRSPIDFNYRRIAKWAAKNWKKMSWNGRQIRNAFQTAVSLAEFEAKQESARHPGSQVHPSLDVKHFKLLAKVSDQFSEYLHMTHGDDEDQRAVRDQVRAGPYRAKGKSRSFSEEDEDDDEHDNSGLGSDSFSGTDSSEDSNNGFELSIDSSNDSDSQGKPKRPSKSSRKSKGTKGKAPDERKEKNKGRRN